MKIIKVQQLMYDYKNTIVGKTFFGSNKIESIRILSPYEKVEIIIENVSSLVLKEARRNEWNNIPVHAEITMNSGNEYSVSLSDYRKVKKCLDVKK